MSIDTDSNPLLTSYLSERARGNGALYRLLRQPDHQNGLAHTPREIAQQPFLWRETAHPSIDKGLYSRTVKGVHIYEE